MAPPIQHGYREMPDAQNIVKFNSPCLHSSGGAGTCDRGVRLQDGRRSPMGREARPRGVFSCCSKSAVEPFSTFLQTLVS